MSHCLSALSHWRWAWITTPTRPTRSWISSQQWRMVGNFSSVARRMLRWQPVKLKTLGSWRLIVRLSWQQESRILFLIPSDLPQAVLKLGPNFDATKIKEGDDVYFECSIEAQPDIYKTSWWFNVSWWTSAFSYYVGKLKSRIESELKKLIERKKIVLLKLLLTCFSIKWIYADIVPHLNHNFKLDQFVARFSLVRRLL